MYVWDKGLGLRGFVPPKRSEKEKEKEREGGKAKGGKLERV